MRFDIPKVIKMVAGVLLLLISGAASAQGAPMPRAAADSVMLVALRNYPAWNSAEFQGRVEYKGLPVQPSVKIYMVRDSLVQVSVRVPLMGEVFRGEITRSQIRIVNKLAKTWCEESTDNLFAVYPGAISDFQSLMLGRAVIFGVGELSLDSASIVDVYESGEEGVSLLVPRHDPGIVEMTYGYELTPAGRTAELVAGIPSRDISIKLDYTYGTGMTLDGTVSINGKNESGRLIFDKVIWGGSPLGELRIPENFRRVGINRIFKLK